MSWPLRVEAVVLFGVALLGVFRVIPFGYAVLGCAGIVVLAELGVALFSKDPERLGYGRDPAGAAIAKLLLPLALFTGVCGIGFVLTGLYQVVYLAVGFPLLGVSAALLGESSWDGRAGCLGAPTPRDYRARPAATRATARWARRGLGRRPAAPLATSAWRRASRRSDEGLRERRRVADGLTAEQVRRDRRCSGATSIRHTEARSRRMLRLLEFVSLAVVAVLGVAGVVPLGVAVGTCAGLPLVTRMLVSMLARDPERLGYGKDPARSALDRYVFPLVIFEGIGGMVCIVGSMVRPGFGVLGITLLALCWVTLWVHRDLSRNMDHRATRRRMLRDRDREQREQRKAGLGAVSDVDASCPGGELSATDRAGALSGSAATRLA